MQGIHWHYTHARCCGCGRRAPAARRQGQRQPLRARRARGAPGRGAGRAARPARRAVRAPRRRGLCPRGRPGFPGSPPSPSLPMARPAAARTRRTATPTWTTSSCAGPGATTAACSRPSLRTAASARVLGRTRLRVIDSISAQARRQAPALGYFCARGPGAPGIRWGCGPCAACAARVSLGAPLEPQGGLLARQCSSCRVGHGRCRHIRALLLLGDLAVGKHRCECAELCLLGVK